MTDWTARDFEIPLSFLGEGAYEMTLMKDGINAGRNAQDYKIETGSNMGAASKLSMHLAKGGGFTAIFNKQ